MSQINFKSLFKNILFGRRRDDILPDNLFSKICNMVTVRGPRKIKILCFSSSGSCNIRHACFQKCHQKDASVSKPGDVRITESDSDQSESD